jgi:zinc transport system substrate-binding protein
VPDDDNNNSHKKMIIDTINCNNDYVLHKGENRHSKNNTEEQTKESEKKLHNEYLKPELKAKIKEELADPRLSQTLVSEIPNGKVLLLSPIEGLNQEEQKKSIGYIDKMHLNLENLKQGLKCK